MSTHAVAQDATPDQPVPPPQAASPVGSTQLPPVVVSTTPKAVKKKSKATQKSAPVAVAAPAQPSQPTRDSGEETATGPVDGFVAKRSATATKTDTPLVETPRSISVVTADQIDKQKLNDIDQALLYTPGVFSGARGFELGSDIYLRGFFTGPSTVTASP